VELGCESCSLILVRPLPTMSTTQTLRSAAKWLFIPLGLLAAVGIVMSVRHGPDLQEQLRAECRARYAAAHTRGDSIVVDNWVPAAGLQGIRRVRHCSDLGFTYRVP